MRHWVSAGEITGCPRSQACQWLSWNANPCLLGGGGPLESWESLCCLLKWTKQNTESCLNYDFNCCYKSNTKVCFSPCEVEPSQVMTNTVLHFRLLQDLLKQCLLGNVHCLVVLTILIVLGIFSNKCFRTGVPVEYIFLKSVWLTEAVN